MITVVMVEGALNVTCLLVGILVGVAIWRERDAAVRREREADTHRFYSTIEETLDAERRRRRQ